MRQEYPINLDLKSFFLRPDTPPEGRPRDENEQEPTLPEPLRTRALEAGLDAMRRPPFVAASRKAHEATEYAKEQGKGVEFNRAVYKAYWEQGLNIGDSQVLEGLANDTGLEWIPLKGLLDEGFYGNSVEEQNHEITNFGVHGVPCFLIDRFLFTGAQPYEFFKQVADRVLAERAL